MIVAYVMVMDPLVQTYSVPICLLILYELDGTVYYNVDTAFAGFNFIDWSTTGSVSGAAAAAGMYHNQL